MTIRIGKQAEKLAFGTMGVDWQERINYDRLRKERLERTLAVAKKAQCPSMILADAANQRYATAMHPGAIAAFVPGGAGFSVVFPESPDDSITFLTEGNLVRQGQFHCTWLKPENIRAVHNMTNAQPKTAIQDMARKNAEEIFDSLKEKGLHNEPVAIDAPIPVMMPYLEKLGIKPVVVGDQMEHTRAIKTVDEIGIMKMVGCIADRAWGALAMNLKPGITENELGGKMAEALQKNGAMESFIVSLRTGPNTAPNYLSHSPVDRVIEAGDMVVCDIIGPLFNGYRACYYRTFKCGLKPTQKEKDMYKTVYEWLYAAIDVMKPGATTADVAKVWPAADTWGYKNEYECWTNCLGHGIGLKQYEIPCIRRSVSLDYPEVLEKGMTIAVETWLGEERIGGVRIENVVVITDNGCENIYMWPDEEIGCPWHQLIW